MTDHEYEAVVETEEGTFTMRGDKAGTVSRLAARMPVELHRKQIDDRVDLGVPIHEYLEQIHKKQQKAKKKPTRNRKTPEEIIKENQ